MLSPMQLFITVMDKLRLEIRAMDEVLRGYISLTSCYLEAIYFLLINIWEYFFIDPTWPERAYGDHE